MSIHQALFMVSGVVLPTQTTLSAVNIDSTLSLVTSNIVEAINSNAGIVLSDSGKTAGKFYAEVSCPQLATGSQALSCGLRRGTGSLNTYLGQSADGWGTWAEGTGGTTRSTYTNATQTNATVTGANALAQRARIAVDIDNGRLYLSYFGNTAWVGGGDPAAGTSPTYSFTPGGSTYYLAFNPRTGTVTPSSNRTRLQLILPNNWNSSAPTGFDVWT